VSMGAAHKRLLFACLLCSPVMRIPQKGKALSFTFTTPLLVSPGEAAEFDESRLLRMELQRKARQPFPEFPEEPLRVVRMLESDHQIVSIADNNDVAAGYFLAPHLDPEIDHIMQIHIGQ
jgi:hypothetical protein